MSKLYLNGLPQTWLFPTTRYRGSKRKILGWIWKKINNLEFNTALDLFGGTSVVSLLFKRMDKQVTYNDYSHFNKLTGIAFIENDSVKLTDEDIKYILRKVKQKIILLVRLLKGYIFIMQKMNG
ncbi:MAG: adenine-specific DNA-methyltransferase [Chloroflexi bacterium OLB14]|nr:MAG: adenine-specific DNA-methyltransferase [Chloroflexi bacterium OLB14]